MEEMIEKIKEIERITSQEKGEYDFFGVLLKEESDWWSIVVSAPWLIPDMDGYSYLGKKFMEKLNSSELLLLSGITILTPAEKHIKPKQKVNVEHGLVEVTNTDFFGVMATHGYIITSRSNMPA